MENVGGTILIVDDDAFSCRLFQELLEREGYQTIIVSSGLDALRVVEENIPDLFLLDAVMPSMSGFELAGRLKADERTRNVPIIMVTALNDEESRLTALKEGAEEFLTKPVHRAELVIRVRNLLRLKKYQDILAGKSSFLEVEVAERTSRLDALQEHLALSEKLASIGQLAAGVAHEINNPISFVNSNYASLRCYVEQFIEVLRRYEALEPLLPPAAVDEIKAYKAKIDLDYAIEDVLQLLTESQDGIFRVRKIIQDLKDFSRTESTESWQRADLRQCLDSTLTIATSEIKYKASVVKQYGDIPEIECLPSQLNQVFLNLLVNASQAIPKDRGGTITLGTGCEAENVWVEVSDTGGGIPSENLKRIFEPFYTTKPVGVGTGLGLSVSYGIVQRHHGRIDVTSEVGKGTTFRVVLPVRRYGGQAENDVRAKVG
ncbi:MAG: response regulator [Betaproteobacteria bacterium]